MRKQPCSRNSAKEESINRFQPIFVNTGFHEVSKHLVPPLNQLSAISDIIVLTAIDLTYRGVFYIRWYAEKLTEQMNRLTNVTINEADGRCLVILTLNSHFLP